MIRQLLGVAMLAVVVAPGCKHAATETEIGQLEGLAKVVEQNPNPDIVLTGAAEAKLGSSGACLEALSGYAKSNPSMRGALGAKAVESCGFACPSNLAPYAKLPADQRMTELLKDCGASDAVFTGDAAKDRASFDFFAYVLVRGVMEQAVSALDRSGSPRAQAVKKSLLALPARLAPVMVDRARRKP
jgi:hypothetical protein